MVGQFRWQGDAREVMTGPEKSIAKKVRDGIIADKSGSVIVSIWGEQLINQVKVNSTQLFRNLVKQPPAYGVKVATTQFSTIEVLTTEIEVNWTQVNIPSSQATLCCPEIVCSKANGFLFSVKWLSG